jgi:hypothetical protein
MKEIEFTIDSDGNVSFEFKGTPGAGCLKETQELEAALGKVTDRDFTPEYYQDAEVEEVEEVERRKDEGR